MSTSEVQFRKNIRSRLMTLVLLPLIVTGVSLVAMERLLERQILQDATNRVLQGQDVVQLEMDEHRRALHMELLGVANSRHVVAAMQSKDRQSLKQAFDKFHADYPGIHIIAADAGGKVLHATNVGDVSHLSQLETLVMPKMAGEVTRALSMHGCQRASVGPKKTGEVRQSEAPPARIMAVKTGDSGTLVTCEPLDARFLDQISAPLHMKLALVDESRGHLILSRSSEFPVHAHTQRGQSALMEVDGDLWAVSEFCPRLFEEGREECAVDAVGAMSVSKLRDTVRKDFLLVLLPMLLAGAVALFLGGRIAFTLNQALEGLLAGFRKLEQHDLEPIVPVRTGNELEELGHGFNSAIRGLKERDRLKVTFGTYMTEAVAEHLLANDVALGGTKLPVTVLFSDVRGFTAMSEELDAEAVVERLNEYFSRMVDVIMAHGGVVDKFIGDALMVIFGAPVPSNDDAERAVRAAVDMQRALAELNAELASRGQPPIRTGIGVHSGEVVAGNIGSVRRMEYTVIGDTVNVASRLEGATKELDQALVVSEATYQLVKDVIEMDFVATVKVKGRDQAVSVYTPSAAKDDEGQSIS